MKKLHINIILWITIFLTNTNFAQENTTSLDISDCSGAIQLQLNQSLRPLFTKKSGATNDLSAYLNELQELETNSLWLKFVAEDSGLLRLAFKKSNFIIEYSLFILSPDESCSAILNRETNLVRHGVVDKGVSIFKVDSIDYKSQQIVYVCLNTVSNINKDIEIQNLFIPKETSKDKRAIEPKIQDFRKLASEEPFHIMIRDAKTYLPIIAKVIISGSKTHDALYTVSDLIFSNLENLKMELKISAKGYFFKDEKIDNRGEKPKELIIQLQPLEKDQLIELESIKFEPQTDVFLSEALPKLKRLRDFMVINPEVAIEIQGHVNLLGKNTTGAKHLSKKRAKRVRKFLVTNGIDKHRISVIGFGNSKMIYPKAESEEEKQANRRVEIRIK